MNRSIAILELQAAIEYIDVAKEKINEKLTEVTFDWNSWDNPSSDLADAIGKAHDSAEALYITVGLFK